MSYDIMLFDRRQRFRTYKEFIAWYNDSVDNQDSDYKVTTPNLQQWFLDIKDILRPLNGEISPRDEELDCGEFPEAEYGFGKEFIYLELAQANREKALEIVMDLARKHHLAYFDISGTGSVYQDAVIDIFTKKIYNEVRRRENISATISTSVLIVSITLVYLCFSYLNRLWGYCISGVLLVTFIYVCIRINKWISMAEQDVRAEYDSSNQQL